MKRSTPSGLQSAPSNTGREDDGLCVNRIATVDPNCIHGIGLRNDLLDLSGKHHFGSKLNRLPERALT